MTGIMKQMHSVGRFKAAPSITDAESKVKFSLPKEYLRRKLFNRKNDSMILDQKRVPADDEQRSTGYNKNLLN